MFICGFTSQPADLSGQAGLSLACPQLNILAVGQICPEGLGIDDGIDESWQWYSCFGWNDIVPDLDEVMKTQQCQRDSEDFDVCGQ